MLRLAPPRRLVPSGLGGQQPASLVRGMSRLGKLAVKIPDSVKVSIEPYAPGELHPIKVPSAYRIRKMLSKRPNKDSVQAFGTPYRVHVEGPLGKLTVPVHSLMRVELEDEGGLLKVSPQCGGESRLGRTMWGTTRGYLHNAVTGVSQGYRKELELQGTGFRARIEEAEGKQTLVLRLGFSHEVEIPAPEGITFTCPTQTSIIVFGRHKQKVGEVAADVRRRRPPDPYKGKGVRYVGEKVTLKAGKRK